MPINAKNLAEAILEKDYNKLLGSLVIGKDRKVESGRLRTGEGEAGVLENGRRTAMHYVQNNKLSNRSPLQDGIEAEMRENQAILGKKMSELTGKSEVPTGGNEVIDLTAYTPPQLVADFIAAGHSLKVIDRWYWSKVLAIMLMVGCKYNETVSATECSIKDCLKQTELKAIWKPVLAKMKEGADEMDLAHAHEELLHIVTADREETLSQTKGVAERIRLGILQQSNSSNGAAPAAKDESAPLIPKADEAAVASTGGETTKKSRDCCGMM